MNPAEHSAEPARDESLALSLARDIVVAYVATKTVEPEQLPQLIREVRAALEFHSSERVPAAAAPLAAPIDVQDSELSPVLRPAVPVERSITPDYIISLEDGKPYRSLKRHLMAKHGLTPEQYREKWGLRRDYPMVAPNYARDRSEVAKRIGLGKPSVSKPSAQRPRRGRIE